MQASFEILGGGGGGGVLQCILMHEEPCVKLRVAGNPNDKISEISSSCSIILSCFPLKKQMQKMNRINSSCTQVKTERIHYSLPMFFSHLD